MGDCTVFYEEMRFDVRDPDTTHVYVFIRGEGDCPFMVHGWHHKAYPSTTTTFDIMKAIAAGEDMLLWEREAPQAQVLVSVFNPHEYVPVRAQELINWRASLLVSHIMSPITVADAITARLAMVPQWDKACPLCRAQGQMEPPQL